MNGPSGAPAGGVPTLTEVVAWPTPATTAPPPLEPAAEALPLEAEMAPSAPQPLASASVQTLSDEQIVQRVLADLQRQIDLMLDYRLREILTPILTRAADGVVRDARTELASTLRDVVTRAVTQELARHRSR